MELLVQAALAGACSRSSRSAHPSGMMLSCERITLQVPTGSSLSSYFHQELCAPAGLCTEAGQTAMRSCPSGLRRLDDTNSVNHRRERLEPKELEREHFSAASSCGLTTTLRAQRSHVSRSRAPPRGWTAPTPTTEVHPTGTTKMVPRITSGPSREAGQIHAQPRRCHGPAMVGTRRT